MAEDRWYAVALPILDYVHDNGGPLVLLHIGDIAEGTGLDPVQVATEVERLSSADYLAGSIRKLMSGDDPSPWFLENSSLGERGLRVVGAWPSDDPYEALMDLLEQHIEATSDPTTKSKLSALRGSVSEVGKATIAGLLVELAKGNFHF